MTRVILSLSGQKEETIRDIPHIIGKVLNSPEMQAITRDAAGLALERISGRRIKWLIGCNEQTIYLISGRSTRHPFTAATDTLQASVPEAAWRLLRAVSKCVAGRIRRAHLSRATVAASGLTANPMIG